jgi:hypothetical protein
MRRATSIEFALLTYAGYFPWGFGSWVRQDEEGEVLTTEEALEEAVDRVA